MGVTAAGIYCVWQRDEESMTLKRLAITLRISVRRIGFVETTEGYTERQIIQKGLSRVLDIPLKRFGG